MADGDHFKKDSGDLLWDIEGQEWRRSARWATASQAAAFVGEDRPVASCAGGRLAAWMDPEAAASWWQQAKRHDQVPGKSDGHPDPQGRSWGAHVYRRGDDRLLVVEEFC